MHRFGGAWTEEVKLDAVNYDLEVLHESIKGQAGTPRQPFELWGGIDAFAGSGSRRINRTTGGLFEGEPLGEETVDLAGQALRALDVYPGLSTRLVFIEENRDQLPLGLQDIAVANPTRNIIPLLLRCKYQATGDLRRAAVVTAAQWTRVASSDRLSLIHSECPRVGDAE